jgi:hypothetical protein
MLAKKILTLGLIYSVAIYLLLFAYGVEIYGYASIKNSWLILLVFTTSMVYLLLDLSGATRISTPIQLIYFTYSLIFFMNIAIGRMYISPTELPPETIDLIIAQIPLSNLFYSASAVLVICLVSIPILKIANSNSPRRSMDK